MRMYELHFVPRIRGLDCFCRDGVFYLDLCTSVARFLSRYIIGTHIRKN